MTPRLRRLSPGTQPAAMGAAGEAAAGQARLAAFLRCLCDGARLMVGQPSFEVYLAHMQANHPDSPPMSRAEFFRNREAARFGAGNSRGFRCC